MVGHGMICSRVQEHRRAHSNCKLYALNNSCFLMKCSRRIANTIIISFWRMLQADAQHSKRCTHCLPRCTEMSFLFAPLRNYEVAPHELPFVVLGSHFEKVAFQTSRGCKHRSWTALCAQPAVVEKSKSRHPQYL